MRKYFIDGLEHASGGNGGSVVVRQIFYAVRKMINLNHPDVKEGKNDYKYFTQHIATEFIDSNPDLERRILFEARGSFLNSFTGEISLSTENVTDFIESEIEDRIYVNSFTMFDIPVNLKFNQVLFVEKQGFNKIFKEKGLIDELNLGVMSSQGFGTRATKKFIDYFIRQGIKVYVLTDCDIAGYLIASKFERGSKTYGESLDVERIGLTVADVDRLGKRSEAETVTYKSKKDLEGDDLPQYDECLEMLTEDEYKFLVKDKAHNVFRRVEINTLTVPELVQFVRDKIKVRPIRPTLEQLENYIEIDADEIIKLGLFKAFGDSIEIDVDLKEIAQKVRKAINKKEHWTITLENVTKDFIEEKSDRIAEKLHVE